MKTAWDYIKTGNGIRICRAWGQDTSPVVPAEIEGCPVTEIGPYAFSEADLPRRFRTEGIRQFVTGSDLWEKEEGKESGALPERIAGGRLLAVTLPDTVTAIGDYAFYGCTALKQIGFSGQLSRIGSGAFMGCGKIRRLEFRADREDGTDSSWKALSLFLSELRYALTVTVTQAGKKTRLVFPEYYEASVENIPARIFEVHFQGTGYRYRQCFRGGRLDYREYDHLFRLAAGQEPASVLTELAYCRLKYPDGLLKEAKQGYLDWFSAHVREAGAVLLAEEETEKIRFLAEEGAFDGLFPEEAETEEKTEVVADGAGDFYIASLGEHIVAAKGNGGRDGHTAQENAVPALDVLLEMAGRKRQTEAVSCLMDHLHKKQGSAKKKKNFEL